MKEATNFRFEAAKQPYWGGTRILQAHRQSEEVSHPGREAQLIVISHDSQNVL